MPSLHSLLRSMRDMLYATRERIDKSEMRCDPEVFAKGVPVMLTHSIDAEVLEAYVRLIAAMSKQRVDWHFAGGRARILVIGDVHRVVDTIVTLFPLHDILVRYSRNSDEVVRRALNGHPIHKPYFLVETNLNGNVL